MLSQDYLDRVKIRVFIYPWNQHLPPRDKRWTWLANVEFYVLSWVIDNVYNLKAFTPWSTPPDMMQRECNTLQRGIRNGIGEGILKFPFLSLVFSPLFLYLLRLSLFSFTILWPYDIPRGHALAPHFYSYFIRLSTYTFRLTGGTDQGQSLIVAHYLTTWPAYFSNGNFVKYHFFCKTVPYDRVLHPSVWKQEILTARTVL